jgi:hypothetical protein
MKIAPRRGQYLKRWLVFKIAHSYQLSEQWTGEVGDKWVNSVRLDNLDKQRPLESAPMPQNTTLNAVTRRSAQLAHSSLRSEGNMI